MIAPLPTGWRLAVLASTTDDDYCVGVLPVVALYSNGDIIEPVVALQSGEILRASALDYDVLCLAAPDEDPRKIAQAVLIQRGQENVRLSDTMVS